MEESGKKKEDFLEFLNKNVFVKSSYKYVYRGKLIDISDGFLVIDDVMVGNVKLDYNEIDIIHKLKEAKDDKRNKV